MAPASPAHLDERPPHPGAFFRDEILPRLKQQPAEVAELLGISHFTFYDFLDDRTPVTASMALRLGKLCGNGPESWLSLQAGFELWQARKVVNIDKIPTLEVWDENERAG
jgi:addiction module HigA family antidote